MRTRVYVSLKKGLADPQGQTIKQALNDIGFGEIKEVRVGKFLDISIDAKPDEAVAILREISEKVLANPVIEDFSIGEQE
ncbi:MAG: phosphoribosylformylglycinamidine synthase [candidate division Zixibacteria bacterium CG_4_9_14_3_um_filter_46_8]|nr:MAG: phosphoribosylformylglycinamidine synthase [candidate division Zixibacteria bacterium CG_4_9_14_3_um_filter_46_8]